MPHQERRRTRADVAAHARQLLESLGKRPEQVAATLARAGVRGVPGDARSCAVARFLGAVVACDPDIRGVAVTASELVVLRRRWWVRPVTVELPEPVREFVAAFDRGRYPEVCEVPQRGEQRLVGT